MNKFKIGDIVKVTDNGEAYSSHIEWVKKFAPEFLSKFKYNFEVKNKTQGIVVAFHEHTITSEMVYAIQINSDRVVLIGQDGIKAVRNNKSTTK